MKLNLLEVIICDICSTPAFIAQDEYGMNIVQCECLEMGKE